MAQKMKIQFIASREFIDRLNKLSSSMGVSEEKVIIAAIDTLELVVAADRQGKGIVFVPKEQPPEP